MVNGFGGPFGSSADPLFAVISGSFRENFYYASGIFSDRAEQFGRSCM
jgi:hypothetical protein